MQPSLVSRGHLIVLVVTAVMGLSCGTKEQPLAPRSQTWAELRAVRMPVAVATPGDAERAPYPRERLVDAEVVHVGKDGLAWLRRDGGATLLVRGPATVTMRRDAVEVAEGRVFIDSPGEQTTHIVTPQGPVHLVRVRASLDVTRDRGTEAYVLTGEVRLEGAAAATAGERLKLTGALGAVTSTKSPALAWEDWTGGLATTDKSAEPAPFGVGTVGARKPGDAGAPRSPLAIQRLDVRVSVDEDLATTEVDQTFFNPSSDVVEGIYQFRTPDGAILGRFGVDREGVVVWGRVKEKAAAAAQYASNVYQGSTEDPALLEWNAPGVYRAKLYPIGPGESRRVVVRYTEWLGRTGAHGERRMYVYPMAAEGSEESLPRIEELTATFDLERSHAREVRTGMGGSRAGYSIIVRAHDLVPRADLAVELFDDGVTQPKVFRAPHVVDTEVLPPSQRDSAQNQSKGEADYVVASVRGTEIPRPPGGLDLVVVVDTSAATERASLAVARSAVTSLLAHLGDDDRAVVLAGDVGLRPVVEGWGALRVVDERARRAVGTGLALAQRGGATDLGAMLADAAAVLDPKRQGAVVYVGDGRPTVGELSFVELRDRLAKLPRPVRMFALGVGADADLGVLKGMARGGFAEPIGDAATAARAALRLLEAAGRPAWLGASVDLGPTVERIFPRQLGALVDGESQVIVGRLVGGPPNKVRVTSPAGKREWPVTIAQMDDCGDLRARWAEARLAQMLDEGAGRAALVDLGSRYGIITPHTSFYVPTTKEMSGEERSELSRRRSERRAMHAKPREASSGAAGCGTPLGVGCSKRDAPSSATVPSSSDESAGGAGSRAKGEEGAMASPAPVASAAPAFESADEARAPQAAMKMRAPSAPAATAMNNASDVPADDLSGARSAAGVSNVAGDLRLGGAGAVQPGGAGAGLGSLGSIGGASARGDGPARAAPTVSGSKAPATESASDQLSMQLLEDAKKETFGGGPRAADPQVSGVSSSAAVTGVEAVIARLRPGFKLCYQKGLKADPTMAGKVIIAAQIGSNGEVASTDVVSNAGLSAEVVACIQGKIRRAEFGAPADGRGARLNIPVSFVQQGPGPKQDEKDRAAKSLPALTAADVRVEIDALPHSAWRCSGAASLAIEERISLWRERLAQVRGNTQGVVGVYRAALARCESPSWRERSRLLALMLDAMPTVSGRVQLWRTMLTDTDAADALYRGILGRVRTPAELRELHTALGLKTVEPSLRNKRLDRAKSPADRAEKLRALALQFPDDFELALNLLDALEDSGDGAAARDVARKLRARSDADAHLRTAVGELYLRLAKSATSKQDAARDEAEARRTFGEIVEFSPEDPVARRRLGDLLRAHGWFAEAARQYETLARLAPDDATVALLLSAAAEGRGLLEEAVRWTEKTAAAGAPDSDGDRGLARTSRAIAATYLAWGRLAAREAGKADELRTLLARAARLAASDRGGKRGARAVLTWSHPEVHPTLWSNALGTMMPAEGGDVTLGIAQSFVPDRAESAVEVRVEPDEIERTARLGAEVTLTVLFDEGQAGERSVRLPVRFARGGPPVQRFTVVAGEVKP